MKELLKARLSPFRHRDFRHFFIAQTLSMVGTWSHDLARSWIIVEATGRSGALGDLNLAISIPALFLILQAGVLVDRTDVRRLIQKTKSLLGVSSLVLAAIAGFSHVQVWQLLIFALIEGFIVAFDSPAFQALTVRMVPRGDFQQAIALNSLNFHCSRMLGPLVAGLLMAWSGPGLVFLFDSLTYFLVAWVLVGAKLNKITLIKSAGGPGLIEGLKYIAAHTRLRFRVMQLMLTIGCIYPLMVAVFRVYVQRKFSLSESQFGEVFAFPALGSMAGAFTFAFVKPREPVRALYFGVPLVSIALLVMPELSQLSLTVAAMSVAGFGVYLSFASLTVSMQLDVQEEFRGRLSAVIGLGFSAIGPMMCFPWGHLADRIGAPSAIFLSATIFAGGSLVLAILNRRVKEIDSMPRSSFTV